VSVDRDGPCPCGSGKKLKKCCARKAERAARPPDRSEERQEVRSAALHALSHFAARPEFDEVRTAALHALSGPDPEDTEEPDEPLEEDLHVKWAFYLYFDVSIGDGRSLAEVFLERQGYQLTERQQRQLRRFAAARLRPYEVEEVRLDEGLRLRDLWSGQEVQVSERSATHHVGQWDLVVARVAPDDDGIWRLEGAAYPLPRRIKQRLLDALKHEERRLRRGDPGLDEDRLFRHCAPLVHHLWLEEAVNPPLPSLVTAEGDPIVFGKVAFDVLDAPTARAALEGLPEFRADEDGTYAWTEDTGDGTTRSLGRITLEDEHLLLEVTSRQRAARGRQLLEAAAGDSLRHRATRYESVQMAIERHRSKPREEAPPPVPPEVAAELIREYKERHYRTWPDEPLPGLDGRTPRQAARLKTLRPRLVDMLKDMENMEARATRPQNPAYDFGWIWKELDLERPT
jgi:hypothetical protein